MTYEIEWFDKGGHVIDADIVDYDRENLVISRAVQKCKAEPDYHAYCITDMSQNGVYPVVARNRYGYDMDCAIKDLRCYRNMHGKRPIAGWEFFQDGFRALEAHGYIVPSENHLDHEAGYWDVTEKGARVGKYLYARQQRPKHRLFEERVA